MKRIKNKWLIFYFKFFILFFLLFYFHFSSAQKQGYIWCFGDSAGIDFSSGAPVTFASGMDGRGSCASIADNIGQLLFYANTRAGYLKSTRIWNKLDTIMTNGDTIMGGGWYHELIIIPKPQDDSVYYLFSVEVTASFFYGLYYSVVDLKQNNGLGAVIQKNIQLMPDQQADCISAVKHGNGRDWWIVGRRIDPPQWNNEYYNFLVSPSGINGPYFQNIGIINETNVGKISFSPSGDTLLFTNGGDVIEYFNFDRCTGLLSNALTVRPQALVYSEWTWSNEFSANGRYIYTSTSKDTTQLFQYDLQAANPLASRVVLYQSTFPQYCGGDLKRGPDGKIYFSIAYENVVPAYPYPDSIYNMYNMNLSVINSTDSLGLACNFTPYSFYLGGKRTYYGLPNNPDYELGAATGSICDSLTGISNPEYLETKAEMFVYYAPNWQTVFINAQKRKGSKYLLQVFDLLGNIIFSEEGKLQPPYFTKNLSCTAFAKGMYIVSLQTEKEKLVKKFVKE